MTEGPILRMFEVQTKPGCADQLLRNFATTSAAVVKDKPGNQGYFFGRTAGGSEDAVQFVSVWESLAAIQNRFGDAWQESFIPDGYEDLIESYSLRHFDMAGGWHVAVPSTSG